LALLALLLTVLISISDPPRSNNSTTEQNKNATYDVDLSISFKSVILLIDVLYILVIIIQIIFYIRLRKVFHPIHFCFEVGSIIFTAVFLLTNPTKWEYGVGALVCSWVALNLFSRYFDVFGLYTIMFYDLLFQIVKVLLVGLYYIIGFGLILYILIGEEFLYEEPYLAIYSGFFAAISRLDIDDIAELDEKDKLQHPIITYVVALIFNVVLSITLINLLIGIAVNRIGKIQDGALLYQAKLKVQLFFELDPIIPKFLQHKIFFTKHKVKGSNAHSIGGFWNQITAYFAHKDELHENEEIMTDQEEHQTQEIASRIHQMEKRIDCIFKILTANSKK